MEEHLDPPTSFEEFHAAAARQRATLSRRKAAVGGTPDGPDTAPPVAPQPTTPAEIGPDVIDNILYSNKDSSDDAKPKPKSWFLTESCAKFMLCAVVHDIAVAYFLTIFYRQRITWGLLRHTATTVEVTSTLSVLTAITEVIVRLRFIRQIPVTRTFIADAAVVIIIAALGFYRGIIGVRLLSLLRMWRFADYITKQGDRERRLAHTVLAEREASSAKVAAIEKELEQAKLKFEQQGATRSRLETLVQDYKEKVEFLRETLYVAAHDVALVGGAGDLGDLGIDLEGDEEERDDEGGSGGGGGGGGGGTGSGKSKGDDGSSKFGADAARKRLAVGRAAAQKELEKIEKRSATTTTGTARVRIQKDGSVARS